MKNNEIWKPVVGYEDEYIVSSTGVVISLPRVTTRIQNQKIVVQPIVGRTLKQHKSAGYPAVVICKDGIPAPKYVHELVAEAFIGPRPTTKHHICHNDGDENNNGVDNLRYDTPTGNAADRHQHNTDAAGINNPGNKYSEDFIRNIKRRLKTETVKEVYTSLGIPRTTVSGIKNGHHWGHVSVD